MLLAAILFLGILSMWVPARWALSAFQVAVFALAAFRLVKRDVERRTIALHPTAILLSAAVVWGLVQVSAGWTVDRFKTLNEVLNWTVNLTVFALALELSADRQRRKPDHGGYREQQWSHRIQPQWQRELPAHRQRRNDD